MVPRGERTIVRTAAGPVFIQRGRNVQRMHICTTGISVGRKVGSFPPLVAEFSQNPDNRKLLHCRIRMHSVLLWRTINCLPPPFPARMTSHAHFAWQTREALRSPRAFC
jgi:hypothetical protein